MKKLVFLGIALAMGCGGSLTDEQRKKLREGMEEQQIVRLSDAEIMTTSLELGRNIFDALERVDFHPAKADSLGAVYQVRLRHLIPGSPDALEVENQVIEAYVLGAETGATQDNIQKLRSTPSGEDYDSLMYSRPVIRPQPDGSIQVDGVWNIYFSKRDVIITASKND
jgi:hypothetical protein